MGRSRGGLTTKVHALVDANGMPIALNNRYNRWESRGIWQRLFERIASAGPVPDELSIDSTHVKAHRSAAG